MSRSPVNDNILSLVVLGAGFLVAQLVLICLPPSHCPPICWMAFSASWWHQNNRVSYAKHKTQLLLNLFPALTTLQELPRHSPICWRRTQSHSLSIYRWPCLWPPDSPCGYKSSLWYCQLELLKLQGYPDWLKNLRYFPKGAKSCFDVICGDFRT